MAVMICGDCGSPKSEHALQQEKTKLQHQMATMAASVRTPEHREAMEKTIVEWRTHALPPCDPLAIA